MFKINIMSIIKYISAVFCLILACFAAYLVGKSKTSQLPAAICVFIPFIIDGIISHILVKKGHENSPYFDPKHQWKYGLPLYAVDCLIVIVIYKYLL